MILKNYIQDQIKEIGSYKSLRWYGFFLSLTHVVTFFFWHHNGTIYQNTIKNANTVCWPQIPFCESLRVLSPFGVEVLLYVYLCLAFFTAFIFLNKKFVTLAYWLFLTVNVIKFYLFFLDYLMMGNYHYMPFLVSFCFLFIRQKLFFIPILITSFYFFAGLLKISNLDWLTGLAFSQNLNFPLFFNEEVKLTLCFYVVCLEIIGSWFLILKTRWKAAVLVQFVLFHIMSYFFTGYFYPLVMLCLLSLFFLIFVFQERVFISLDIKKLWPGILFMCLVVAGNLLSFFIPGREGLTGEGRLWGVNMYDAHTQCNSQIFLKFKNQTIQESFTSHAEYSMRIHCDPYIDFNTVKKACDFYKDEPEFIDIDWSLYIKLRSDLEYKKIVNEENVCSKNLKYSSLRKNPWIKSY
ncbi:MAG: hypothetical protein OXH36_01040 [Bdellovibrionales bacterium]|nr:hypothetical protein [Bdellovibrionales bacterium]